MLPWTKLTFISVYDVKKAVLDKWSSAGVMFSPSSPLLLNDKNREHLKQIYKTFIRSNLEFSSNVWHSGLTKENKQDLERVQKAALRVILGGEYLNYENALRMTKLESLEERRKLISLKFAKSCLKNENFSKLFPLRKIKHAMNVRKPDKYVVANANTERYKRSTIPYLQRLLNVENQNRKTELNKLQLVGDSKRKYYL